MPRVRGISISSPGFGVYALGRSHPALKAALHQAIDLDLPNMVQMDCSLLPGILAEQLVARCPEEINRVFFCNSGAEAIESAIKFSRQATQRPRILFAEHAFHGLTTGALSLNGGAEFREGFGQLLPGSESVPFGDIEALRRALQEPRRGSLHRRAHPGQGRLHGLCGVLERGAGALPIVTELFWCSMRCRPDSGRTGKFFCYEHWDLKPDIITVSKALSGGYVPVGAVLMTDQRLLLRLQLARESAQAFDHLRAEPTGHGGRPGHPGHLRRRGHRRDGRYQTGLAFEAALAPLVERYEMFHEVRGKGLMIGLAVRPSASRRPCADASTPSSTCARPSSAR